MRPITVSVGPLAAASPNNIAQSQTPSGASNLILNGTLVKNGVAVLDNPRRILITTTDTTHTFTITGTSPTGAPLSESFKVSTATYSQLDYAYVTQISVDGTPTGAVTVGTNGIASTPWVRLDEWASPACSVQIDASGTVNWTLQVSNDDPNSATNPVSPSAMTWINTNDANAVGATGSVQTNFLFSPTFARVLLNSSTSPGNLSATFIQYGVNPA